MKAAAGASPDRRGYALLVLLAVISGLAITGVLLLPGRTQKIIQDRREKEEGNLSEIERGFRNHARLQQSIPGTSTWVTVVATACSLSVTQVAVSVPEFPTNASLQRAYVIDNSLGGASPLLPYTQSTNGLVDTFTNLMQTNARVMFVSSTKPGLSLPVASGFLAQSDFDAIWNWRYDPSSQSPPSGWPSSWNGNARFLHVRPVQLPGLFSTITLRNTRYGVGDSSITTTSITTSTALYFLNGTRLALGPISGTLKRTHAVTRDDSFDFTTASPGPVLWYRFSETASSTAANSGSYGSSWNGTFMGGGTLGGAGPRPPTYTNYAANNTCVASADDNSKVETGERLTSALPGFVIAAWVKISYWEDDFHAFLGVRDSLELGTFKVGSSHFVQLSTKNGGSVSASYDFSATEWHHVAGVGDGSGVYLFIDGVLAAQSATSISDYAYDNGNTFKVGANPKFTGAADEVVFYTNALTVDDVARLAIGALP